MATLTDNQNGSWTLVLDARERDTMAMLPAGQLAGYLTLWLHEREKDVLQTRFSTLTDHDQATVMTTLQKADAVLVEDVPLG